MLDERVREVMAQGAAEWGWSRRWGRFGLR